MLCNLNNEGENVFSFFGFSRYNKMSILLRFWKQSKLQRCHPHFLQRIIKKRFSGQNPPPLHSGQTWVRVGDHNRKLQMIEFDPFQEKVIVVYVALFGTFYESFKLFFLPQQFELK